MHGVPKHGLGRFALGVAVGLRDQDVGDQTMAVVTQGVAHEAQAAGVVALAVQPCIGIGARDMRVVAAAFVSEVAVVRGVVAAVFAHKAFVPSPGLDEGAVYAEVLAREQAFALGLRQHLIEQLDHRVVRDQAFAVLAEDGGHPHGVVHGQADEPAKQQVVLGLLHELALRAHAVEHLQQHGAQQFLGRDAGTAALDVGLVHPREERIHLHQGGFDHLAGGAQRMALGDEVFKLAEREQALGEGVGSAHARVSS